MMFISARIVVVLPAPFGPSRAKTVPDATAKEIPLTASTRRYRHVRLATSITVSTASSFPRAANGLEHVGQRHAGLARLDDQPVYLGCEHRAPRRIRLRPPRGDDGADPGTRLEQAALDQRRDDLLRRIRIDLELLAERAHGWERVPGRELAGDDGLGDGKHDLVVQRPAGPKVDAERQSHPTCTIYTSTLR